MTENTDNVSKYVKGILRFQSLGRNKEARSETALRIEKAFSLMPRDVLELFLSGERALQITVGPDTGFPLGMRTKTQGPPDDRKYAISMQEEEVAWPEERFLGSFLRELGHVVAQRPPESEWPEARGDRSRFRERLEAIADAMVWRWGLRHYNMSHLAATYPAHRLEMIITQIGEILEEEQL